jgi:antitoxin ParD1/3/4
LAYYANMATRNVVLTERQETLIETLVESGRYQNASEILREGLRLLEEREAENAAKLARLREAVRIGEESFERGEARTFETAEELKEYFDELTERITRERRR